MRRALAAAVPLVTALAGCGGDQVVLTPTRVETEREALACRVEPRASFSDDTICDRSLDDVTSHPDELRRTLAALQDLALSVTAIDDGLFDACEAIRTWSGDDSAQYEQHAIAGRNDNGVTTEGACRLAEDALKNVLPSIGYVGVSVTRGACHDPAPFPCMVGVVPERQCVLTVTVETDSPGDRVELEKLLRPIFDAQSLLEVMPNDVSAVASVPQDLAQGCATEMKETLVTAQQQIGTDAAVFADLSSTLVR